MLLPNIDPCVSLVLDEAAIELIYLAPSAPGASLYLLLVLWQEQVSTPALLALVLSKPFRFAAFHLHRIRTG